MNVTHESNSWRLELGANVLGDGRAEFKVWAPSASSVDLMLLSEGKESIIPMKKYQEHFSLTTNANDGTKYFYILNSDKKRADPVSRFQPDGVHGPSQVVDASRFKWTDEKWGGVSMDNLIIYELHPGTYSEEGTFHSVIQYLDYLGRDLGINAIELMPIGQFPGGRNWGYDGVFMYAPQNTYGGPLSLKDLINSCHNKGIAVLLDVVYNHVGPEGNYFQDFGPYFSHKYHTPWGSSFNYDDTGCDNVRNYVISNALYWTTEYHFDGLRLDAIHGIFDFSPKHILEEIKNAVENQAATLGRDINIIAESDLNDPKIVKAKEDCGYGLDGQWSDDFHHSVHAYLTEETYGYYQDFGSLEDIAKSLSHGFVYDGKYSRFRGRKHGKSSEDIPSSRFVISLQNHDQVGNRPDGLRLAVLLNDKNILKVAAGLLILSPYVPLLFMGEEFGERAPFYYFISHTDADLVKAVREGRKKEFAAHHWESQYVDPQDETTFMKSKINHNLRLTGQTNAELFKYYCDLIKLRKAHPALSFLDKRNLGLVFDSKDKTMIIHRHFESEEELLLIFNLGANQAEIDNLSRAGTWRKIHDSNASTRGDNSTAEWPNMISGARSFDAPPYALAIYTRTS